MLRTSKIWLALAATGTALTLATAPALAETITVSDADDDAVEIFDEEVTGVDDYDIDLRSVVIDHGVSELSVTSAFDVTNADSWTEIFVDLDTDLDGRADYVAFWSKSDAVSGVGRISTEEVTCAEIGRTEKVGVKGTVTLTIPRSCFGAPARVAVRVDVLWDGLEAETGASLTYVDSAPDVAAQGVLVFSPAVAAAAPPVTVPSPNPPTINPLPGDTGPSAACVKAKNVLKKAKKSKSATKIKKARKKVKRAC